MNNSDNGWDKITEQSKNNVEKQRKKEKFEKKMNIARVSFVVISIVCIIFAAAVIMAIYGVNILR